MTAFVNCANRNIQMGDCWCRWIHVCYLCCCKSPCPHCKFWRAMVLDRRRDILVAVGAFCLTETLFLHNNCIGLLHLCCISQEYTQIFYVESLPHSLNIDVIFQVYIFLKRNLGSFWNHIRAAKHVLIGGQESVLEPILCSTAWYE